MGRKSHRERRGSHDRVERYWGGWADLGDREKTAGMVGRGSPSCQGAEMRPAIEEL